VLRLWKVLTLPLVHTEGRSGYTSTIGKSQFQQIHEITLYLDAHTVRPGQSKLKVMIFKITTEQETHETLNMSFDIPDTTHSFSAGLLRGILHILQNTSLNTLLTICSSSDYLAKSLVTERSVFENDMLHSNSAVIKSVVASLNERTGRVCFKRIKENPAKNLRNDPA
jgi:secreted Zn-dependent insulinase-like peptidase